MHITKNIFFDRMVAIFGGDERLVISFFTLGWYILSDDDEEYGDEIVALILDSAVEAVPPLRRSSRNRKKPVRFIDEYTRYY